MPLESSPFPPSACCGLVLDLAFTWLLALNTSLLPLSHLSSHLHVKYKEKMKKGKENLTLSKTKLVKNF